MVKLYPLSRPTCTPHCMGSSQQKVTSRRGGGGELGANRDAFSKSTTGSARSQGAALMEVLGAKGQLYCMC